MSAKTLYDNGFVDLVSVIPPGASLTPTSSITAAQVGKVPGLKGNSGLWYGYDWRSRQATPADIEEWTRSNANIGLKADNFPAVDIDCSDDKLATTLYSLTTRKLGKTACRTGRAPKVLLPYRTTEPFGRMRLWIRYNGETHLVEVLGSGQQYIVHGTHPNTLRPYTWDRDLYYLKANTLPLITRADAAALLDELQAAVEMLGAVCEREGDGKPSERNQNVDQEELLAPSIDTLREVVAAIPNDNLYFPSRHDYIKVCYAIKAAAGDSEDGFAIFADWAERWEGNERAAGNDPEAVRADWKRSRGPYEIGFRYLAELAREHGGYNDAVHEFEAVLGAIPPDEDDLDVRAPYLSDQWLAEEVVRQQRYKLRFVPQRGQWVVWSGSHWEPDAELLAEDSIKRELNRIAQKVVRRGATKGEKKQSESQAKNICSAGKALAVKNLASSDRSIAVAVQALDHNPWVLNTPAGLVDLKTGTLGMVDPDALCTRRTAVAPDDKKPVRWLRFLHDTTGGDQEMMDYLQRLAGYFLTGSTREQQLTFIYGDGGNGKSVFLNTVSHVLGDYATVAAMDTFTLSSNDRHSTELAMLAGARLVTASETTAGKKWDEARVKSITGGEKITARFMRQDNFVFEPQCKLLFAGNHKPELREVGSAMKRRLQMVAFERKPPYVDKELGTKLKEEEAGAILNWMIEGCLLWQKYGLTPPSSVRATTDSYLAGEDTVGRWLDECVEIDTDSSAELTALYGSWKQWTLETGEYTGTLRRLGAALELKGFERGKDSKTRRSVIRGVRLKEQGLEIA